MTLQDTLPRFEDFLGRRLVPPARASQMARRIEHELFLAVGRRLLQGPALRLRCTRWSTSLRPDVSSQRPALADFSRYLARRKAHSSLGRAIDNYLRRLRRRGCGARTLHLHRRAVERMACAIVAETRISAIPAQLWKAVLAALLRLRSPGLASALRHYADFLAYQAGIAAPLAALHSTSLPERRLRRCIGAADRQAGFAGPIGRYLRALRDERQLSLAYLLDVLARLTRFFRSMRGRGCRVPADVTPEHVVNYRDRAIARGHKQMHAMLSLVRCFFAFLRREGELDRNPAEGIRAKVIPRARRLPLTLTELRALAAAPLADLADLPLRGGNPFAQHPTRFVALRDRAILALLMETGLRPGELRSLRLADLDLVRGVLVVRGKGSRTTSMRERRAFVESRELREALAAYLAVRPVGPATAFFLSNAHAALTGSGLVAIVRKRARQAGITRPIRPYDLRVSFASRLVVRGADPFALRVLMGHDSVETTFGLYTSLSLEEVRNVWRETNPLTPPASTRGEP